MRKLPLLKAIDAPFLVGAALTVGFYILVNQEPLKESLLHRYTAEHAVQYVVVWFFFWGLVDVLFRACSFPLEIVSLRQTCLPPRTAREPVANARVMYDQLRAQPRWLQESRLGQRVLKALAHVRDKGSADGFNDYLQYLAAQDEDRTHANFALVRFICWVAPVLGILGTVIHFGSAFGGMSVDEIGDNLSKVVGEIGTAFNTTTVALAVAITMMFSLFVCERTEKGIVHSISRRVDLELRNRFEVVEESLTPFVNTVEFASRATLKVMDQNIDRQMQIWSSAFQRLQEQSENRLQSHAKLWEQTLTAVREQFETSDAAREDKLLRLLAELQVQRGEQSTQSDAMLGQLSDLYARLAQFVDALSALFRGEGELVKLQHVLAENLDAIRQTQQIDGALHELSGAIHLLTARHGGEAPTKVRRAA